MLLEELRSYDESTSDEAAGTKVPTEFAEAIHGRSADLVRLVGYLTELSQIETGVVSLQEEDVDVGRLIEDCARDVLALDNHVPIHTDSCSGLMVRGDRLRLKHVFENVLGNAVKFTPEGHVSTRCLPEGEMVCIEVADTGVGIEKDAIQNVLDPFNQEDDPMTRRFEGAGIGLAIVRRLVELMHGRIEIESEKGRGTSVRIYLPSAPDSDSSPAS